MNVTMKDVALKAGVSKSAVSRTFTEGASVSAKTREKVEAAAKELGFSPNVLASSLTTRKTKLVGLIVTNFHNPVFLQIFDLFTRLIQQHGLRPLLVNMSGQTDPDKAMQMLMQYSVDGVIIASSTLPPSFSQAFSKTSVPIVHSFGRCFDSPTVPTVGVDNRKAGAMVAEFLIQRGYTSFGFLGGPQEATSTQDRLAGFQTIIEKYFGINSVSVSYANDYSFEAGYDAMNKTLKDAPAQVYFCGDDVVSIGAISAIEHNGLNVPTDIGVIGFNDMEMAGWKNIQLTTVKQPFSEIVSTSVSLLVNMLEGYRIDQEPTVIPCTIVHRNTTRALAE